MERLGDILKRTPRNISRESTDTWSSAESNEADKPECPICRGAGFVHPLLPSGRPDFARVVSCQCTGGETEEERLSRLRQDSGDLELKLLRNMTFENFDPKRANLTPEQSQNLGRVYKLAKDFADEPEGWIVLQGTNGCGKTHLAAAIGNYQLKRGKPVLFVFVPDLLDHLRSTFSPDSKVNYDEIFDRVKTSPLLILDDFGEQASTPWAQEKIYQVISHRYNDQLPTVITTCLSLDEIEMRIRSRLIDGRVGTVFGIKVPDYRGDHTDVEMVRTQSKWSRRTR